MIRETSIETYRSIKEDGTLGRLKFQIYEFLFNHGPASIRDAARHFKGQYSNSLSTRFSELRNVGVVREVGSTTDPVTGRRVILWDVTKNLPVKLEKVTSHKCPTCSGTGQITESQGMLF
jgi:predicted transcriptional regulator